MKKIIFLFFALIISVCLYGKTFELKNVKGLSKISFADAFDEAIINALKQSDNIMIDEEDVYFEYNSYTINHVYLLNYNILSERKIYNDKFYEITIDVIANVIENFPDYEITEKHKDNPFDIENNALTNYVGNQETVIIPDNVEVIGPDAFYDRKELKKVVLPKNLKRIEHGAFKNCENLSQINWGGNIEYIGPSAFEGCKNLTTVILSSKLKEICINSFKNCNIHSIDIPQSVEKIGDSAFEKNKLSNFKLQNTEIIIGKKAFAFNEIEELDAECKLIDYAAFKDNSDLKIIKLKNCNKLSEYVFSGCEQINEIYLDCENIGANNFYNCDNLETVMLSDKVNTIEENTFVNCENLRELKLNCETVKNNAFKDCKNLKTIDVSDRVKAIETYAFINCTNVKNIKINSDIKSTNFIKNLQSIETIEFTDKVTSIEDYAFKDIKNLKEIKLNCKEIGSYAFSDCKKLKEVTFSNNATTIGTNAFENCNSLETLIINCKIIDEGAFRNCKELQTVKILSSVLEIKNMAFEGCEKLEKVEFEDEKTYRFPYAFYKCKYVDNIH